MTNPPEETGSTSRPVRARLEKFADLDAFIAGYSQYFFDGGMLLPTRNPREVGSRIHLQLEIRGGVVVVRADGVVERIRNAPDGSPVGMVVRFESTDTDTATLVQRILAERRTRRTADHPAVPAPAESPAVAPAPVAAPTPAPAAPTPAFAASAPPAAAVAPAPSADADEALNAIADSLDESFDAIFGGGDRVSGAGPAVAFSPAPETAPADVRAAETASTPSPAPAESAARLVAAAPAGPAPAIPRGTMVGMPAFDVAAFLEQKANSEPPAPAASTLPDEPGVTNPPDVPESDAGPSSTPSLDLDLDSGEEQGADPRASQPLGRLALQRVARGPASQPLPALAPEPPAASARSILRGITGEMAAVPSEPDRFAPDAGQVAVDRLLSVQPAPVPERSSEDVLDDLLGDLTGAGDARPPSAAVPPEPVLGDEPLAPAKQVAPQGFVARLLAFLRSLFA